MRKIIVAGNWKMNLSFEEAIELSKAISSGADGGENLESVLLFPAYPYLNAVKEQSAEKSFIHVGAQNIAAESSGAFTGEVSCEMIKSMGIDYTLIGHSERRKFFVETHEILKLKVDLAIENNLNSVFCCGETLEDRKSGDHFKIVEAQLVDSLFHVSESDFKNVIVAYEPVWAIGTGETATCDQAEEMHAFIRKIVKLNYSEQIASNLHILYGGSCNASNAEELFAQENIDGGLIGGASLKADVFLSIIRIANG